ncbi:MAG TPA: cytidine deaminase [Bacillota bacterium]|nr:cytidine deaminase [Bacillota bacterium]
MNNQILKEKLIDAAMEAQKLAYVPYSKFKVGAAVLDENGEIHSGCNIENSSYGATNCAERTAIFCAVASGARQIKMLAVVTEDDDYARPCGICRQVMSEFAGPDFCLIALKPDRSYVEYTMEEILPCFFGPDNLK